MQKTEPQAEAWGSESGGYHKEFYVRATVRAARTRAANSNAPRLLSSSYFRQLTISYPFLFLSNSSEVAVKNTSPLLLRAVSTES